MRMRPARPDRILALWIPALAVNAGTDLECGSGLWSAGSPDAFLTLADVVRAGLVEEAALDTALRRLVRAEMRLGVYDAPERVPFTSLTYETVVNSPAHQALALEAARKSLVLLKNDGRTLPLRPDLGTIAVIGPNAADVEVLLGNYSGTPVDPVTVLRGSSASGARRPTACSSTTSRSPGAARITRPRSRAAA